MWDKAQEYEYRWHVPAMESFDEYYYKYFDGYRQLFPYVGLSFDVKEKNILEVGGGPFPALIYCQNRGDDCAVLDTLFYPTYELYNIETIVDLKYTKGYHFDEAWMFNLLQHVKDPEETINRIKEKVNRIIFFEPINQPKNMCHLHVITEDFLIKHFGECNIYPANENAKNFHKATCGYGIFKF